MRYELGAPFEGRFVEYSESWSVGQRNRFYALRGEEFIALIASKITALNLPCAEGDDITEPAALAVESLERLDDRTLRWFLDTAADCLVQIAELGEALRLPSRSITAATGEQSPSQPSTPG